LPLKASSPRRRRAAVWWFVNAPAPNHAALLLAVALFARARNHSAFRWPAVALIAPVRHGAVSHP